MFEKDLLEIAKAYQIKSFSFNLSARPLADWKCEEDIELVVGASIMFAGATFLAMKFLSLFIIIPHFFVLSFLFIILFPIFMFNFKINEPVVHIKFQYEYIQVYQEIQGGKYLLQILNKEWFTTLSSNEQKAFLQALDSELDRAFQKRQRQLEHQDVLKDIKLKYKSYMEVENYETN